MTDPWDEQERREMQAEWEDAVVAENDRLREEVAGLRKSLQTYESENASLRGAAEGFADENDRLRELVRDMYACISHANEQDWFYFERDWSGCGMSCTVNGEGCGLCVLADRMRELGVTA